jgi:hypothetical protein
MRLFTLTLSLVAFVILGGAFFAEQGHAKEREVRAKVEKVLNANPAPDGKSYRIELQLRGGGRVSYEVSPEEATKIADGLVKPAIPGGQRQKVANLVYGMTVEVDPNGIFLIISPRGRTGPLEPLAIPMSGAEPLVAALQGKIAEAKANAAKQAPPAK